jgi:hypothetical protein
MGRTRTAASFRSRPRQDQRIQTVELQSVTRPAPDPPTPFSESRRVGSPLWRNRQIRDPSDKNWPELANPHVTHSAGAERAAGVAFWGPPIWPVTSRSCRSSAAFTLHNMRQAMMGERLAMRATQMPHRRATPLHGCSNSQHNTALLSKTMICVLQAAG